MKKTTKFLSCLLACLMVFSALPVFASTTASTGAAGNTPEAFFADFEGITANQTGETIDNQFFNAGFNKGMAYSGWNTISGNASNGYAAQVVEDPVLGKAWQTPAGPWMYLGVGFDAPVTSGAVKLAFTMKANKDQGFPFIEYATKMGNSYLDNGNGSEPNSNVASEHTYMGAIATGGSAYATLSGASYGAVEGTMITFTDGNYYDFEWVVDVDTDTRYLYVDGVKIGEYKHESDAPINTMQGFYFTHDNGGYATPMIDNILLTTYDVSSTTMNLVKIINGDGKVMLVFDEVIDDTALTAADISFKEAGGTGTISASAIKVVGNILEITCDTSNATAGREYVLTSDNLMSVNGDKKIAPTALVLKDLTENKKTITDKDTYDDINPADYWSFSNLNDDHEKVWDTTKVTSDFMLSRIYPMAYGQNERGHWGRATADVYPIKVDNFDPFSGHNTVLALNSYTNYDIAHNQSNDDEYGVEVYEFDYATKNTARSGNTFGLRTGSRTPEINITDAADFDVSYTPDGTWHHVKLVYDTVNDTAQLFINDKASTLKTGVTSYYALGMNANYCAFDVCHPENGSDTQDSRKGSKNWVVFDNFESYILYTPLTMEGVRFVDSTGKDIIADSDVSAETTQIKVNFSEAVTEASIAGITVNKAGSQVNNVTGAALSADGKSAILTVAGLDYASTYTIDVPNTVTGVSDTSATAATYTFTTGGEGKYTISALKLVDENGAEFTLPGTTGTSVRVTAATDNTEPGSKNVTVIYALYNGTTLVDADFREITLTSSTTAIDEEFTTKPGITFNKCKAFVWDGITSAVPLVTSYEK